VAGAAIFCLGVGQFAEQQHTIVGLALGFSAGVFLCIALADILPEIQFHAHDRMKLSAALVLGVVFAYALGIFESPHEHGHGPADAPHPHEHAPADAHGEEDHEHP
jgi:zinc and cadmium transporter